MRKIRAARVVFPLSSDHPQRFCYDSSNGKTDTGTTIGETTMTMMVTLMEGEDGFFVARCPALKSCWSQGRTREEALTNIREAIDLYLEPLNRLSVPQ